MYSTLNCFLLSQLEVPSVEMHFAANNIQEADDSQAKKLSSYGNNNDDNHDNHSLQFFQYRYGITKIIRLGRGANREFMIIITFLTAD